MVESMISTTEAQLFARCSEAALPAARFSAANGLQLVHRSNTLQHSYDELDIAESPDLLRLDDLGAHLKLSIANIPRGLS